MTQPWETPPINRDVVHSYAQNAEDVRLWRVFGTIDDGFYVDVGAADPTEGSVTRLFYDHGWSGINLEPSPAYDRLVEERPRDLNIRAAVGDEDCTARLFVTYPDQGMSTLDPSAHEHVPGVIERVDAVDVEQRTLRSVLAEHAADRLIHFLKVDVEGSERAVLASNDWTRYRPIVVVVEAIESWEATPTHESWEEILVKAGYDLAAFDGINRFYVERDHRDLIPALAYPMSALDRYVPLAAPVRELPEGPRRAEHGKSLERLTEDLMVVNREKEELQREVERLRAAASDVVAAFYASRTWRAGRAVAGIAGPVVTAARAVRRIVPAGLGASVRKERVAPAQAYANATLPGKPWHFPRTRAKRRSRIASALDDLAAKLPPSNVALTKDRAMEIVAAADALGWAQDESLLSRQLSWRERRALIEIDAVARLVAHRAAASRSEPADQRTGSQHRSSGPEVVVADARALQEAVYRHRGVGRHAIAVLEATRAVAAGRDLILLTSGELPALDPHVGAIADRVARSPYDLRQESISLLVELSPMTASAATVVPILLRSGCASAAAVYDFIPSMFPSAYLPSAVEVISNRARIEMLRYYDVLLPISAATEAVTREMLGESARTYVTGVADPLSGVEPVTRRVRQPFALVPAGGDARKNVPAAMAAIARLRESGSRLRCIVTGVLTPAQVASLEDLRTTLGLPPDALDVLGSVEAPELVNLYEQSAAVIVPSFAEGFSIPVAEAILRRAPVVASDIPAHRELVGDGPWLAPPADVERLAEAVAFAVGNHATVVEQQRRALSDTATPGAVNHRLRDALGAVAEQRPRRAPAPLVGRRGRPRVALVAPFPPQRSGVADYTAYTFRHLMKYADVEVFSAAMPEGSTDTSLAPISAEPFLDSSFDAVINVVGNSHFHFPILDLMASFGGACIAHDNRMVESYLYDRGSEWTAMLLSTPSHRVQAEDVERLLFDLDGVPSIGYDIIAQEATPLIVHARGLADRIELETGIAPVVVPFVPYNVPTSEITAEAQAAARAALGLDESRLHVASFGILDSRTKGANIVVSACAWLKAWQVPFRLHLVGDGPPEERDFLRNLATDLEIGSDVIQHGHVPRHTLDEFFLATDVAVQLRTSSILSLSGAFADCIAYGIPTVTTSDIANELEAPAYVVRTPSRTSSLLVAEAILGLVDRRRSNVAEIERQRREYLAERSADTYARGILRAVGLEIS